MGAELDLEVDTGWIRQAAATLAETARRLSCAAPGAAPAVGTDSLGDDGETVARLVALRCVQAQQATDQLAAVASGMSQQLTLCAETFDRLETGFRWPR